MKISDKRKRYYTKLYIYEKRRVELRKKFAVRSNEYRTSVLSINKKIKCWRRQIKRIDCLTAKLNSLEKAVVSFVGVPIRNINGQNLPANVTLAKGIFYKYAQENGLRGVDALRFIGGQGIRQALFYRKRFTHSFVNKPENREIWLKFKDFYQYSQNAA